MKPKTQLTAWLFWLLPPRIHTWFAHHFDKVVVRMMGHEGKPLAYFWSSYVEHRNA